ncbi:MAG: heavy-metal-associated domain-containing protein [Verrucomicrobiales bacterium]
MKLLQLIQIIAILCIAPLAAAGETSYVGTLTGVECTGCKKTIAKALSKIDGVQTIRIVKNKDQTHRLEVTTDGSKAITKSDANKALQKAEHYQIRSWSKSNG